MSHSDSHLNTYEWLSDLPSLVKGAEWTNLDFDQTAEAKWEPAFAGALEVGRPKVVVVRNAVVLSDPAVMGLLEGEQLTLFTESSPYLDRKQELRRLTFECTQPSLPTTANYDRVAPLCFEWSDNYWHWMTEYLPYALELERVGFDGTYLIPEGRLYYESLLFFGIVADRILTKSADVSMISKMYICERSDGQTAKHPLLIRAVRDACAIRFPPGRRRRLYIARRTRVIVNDSEVINVLKEYGFETFYMEDLSLNEQIQLASASGFICGAHGAGLTAAMFMQDGSALLEMFAPTYVNPCMLGICDSLSHRYAMVVSRQYREASYPHGLDVLVDIPSLKAALTLLDEPRQGK